MSQQVTMMDRSDSSGSVFPALPAATQPQIIRAHQRDLLFLSTFREQTESVLRGVLGTRTLSRWDREANLLTRLFYAALTTGRNLQTLGEEYTDVWQVNHRSGQLPSRRLRALYVLLTAFPEYLSARLSGMQSLQASPGIDQTLRFLQTTLGTAVDVNLALFYFNGRYYNLLKRLLGLRPATLSPPEPGISPPSYGLLGILLSLRLLYRLYAVVQGLTATQKKEATERPSQSAARNSVFIDTKPISVFLQHRDSEDKGQDHALFDTAKLTPAQHSARRCVLCLEERTATSATPCGHLFCWTCVVDWTREKPECPLCREKIDLSALLAIYNL